MSSALRSHYTPHIFRLACCFTEFVLKVPGKAFFFFFFFFQQKSMGIIHENMLWVINQAPHEITSNEYPGHVFMET